MQPSIDTILVCRGLVDALRDMKPVQRLIDVGSGSGRVGRGGVVVGKNGGVVVVNIMVIKKGIKPSIDRGSPEKPRGKW